MFNDVFSIGCHTTSISCGTTFTESKKNKIFPTNRFPVRSQVIYLLQNEDLNQEQVLNNGHCHIVLVRYYINYL